MGSGSMTGGSAPASSVTCETTEWQYPLHLGAAVTVERTATGYACHPRRTFAAATPAWGLSQNDLAAARAMVHSRAAQRSTRAVETGREGSVVTARRDEDGPSDGDPDVSGVAEAFVDLLRHEVIPPVQGFRVVRLVPPPETRGERPVTDDASSVVVGERVVVTWVREIQDSVHEAPRTLAHLDAVKFYEVPEVHGVLLWTSPNGREVPVAWATKYLPRARDGWDWCLDLTQRALGLTDGPDTPTSTSSGGIDTWQNDFPARLGRFVARLHQSLATTSSVIPEPTGHASADLIRAWHGAANAQLDAATELAEQEVVEGVADVLAPRLPAMRRAVDTLLAIADSVESGEGPPVSIQRVHGDLHVGEILRWPGGLAVVDFHPNPVIELSGLSVGHAMQPAARDLARLMRSLDHVARVVDKGTDFAMTDRVDAWSCSARKQLVDAYRHELDAAGQSGLLDERLLAAFEAEQLCREITYAARHLPTWVYAPLGGLWQSFDAEPVAQGDGRRRGRRARNPSP